MPPAMRWLLLLALALACRPAGASRTHARHQHRSAPAAADLRAPAPGAVRLLYSLDARQNDRQLIALIDAAKTRVDFAVYEFTLKDVADALVAAKRRGVAVRGLVDATESAKPYDAPVLAELVAAGIPVEVERHPDRRGIMHVKALVTDSAYASGSYNWTKSATTENDELLEIGTDPRLVAAYAGLLGRLLDRYRDSPWTAPEPAGPTPWGEVDFRDAPAHLGEVVTVAGTVVDAHVTRSGTVHLDFCRDWRGCPFSAVIFARDAAAFGDLGRLAGRKVKLVGRVTSYRGQAEIKLSRPSQLVGE